MDLLSLKRLAQSLVIIIIFMLTLRAAVAVGAFTIKLPSTLKSIEASAFEKCDAITTITLPASLVTIGTNPFAGCESLSDYIVEEGNENFKAANGILTSYDGKTIFAYG